MIISRNLIILLVFLFASSAHSNNHSFSDWLKSSVHGKFVLEKGKELCATECHGVNFEGGSTVSCNKCHESFPHTAEWSGIEGHGKFLIEKDQLFAQQNLDADEYELYLKVYKHLIVDSPIPDMVIYLQAPTVTLLDRIKKRGIKAEQFIELRYLENLNDAYTEFFHYYNSSPLLIVNSAEIDLVNNDEDYQLLVDYILSHPTGTNYFNPGPALL